MKFTVDSVPVLQLLATMDIAEGEEITTRYITPQWDTAR